MSTNHPAIGPYMTTLYICIDESENHTRDRCYSVAGCWCVSSRPDPTNVLTPTKDRLLQLIETHPRTAAQPSELKGAAIHPDTLNDVISFLKESMYDDGTIEQSRQPWSMHVPIGFTIHTLNARLATDSIEGLVGPFDAAETVQTIALSTVLSPLFDSTHLDLGSYNEISVVLDAETWTNPVQRVRENVDEQALDVERITFETRNSKSTPGIQLADIAAYSWRRNHTRGDCETAAGLLHDLRFAR